MGSNFDKRAAKRAREKGISEAEAAADIRWLDEAELILSQVCLSRPRFTAEDLWKAGLSAPREPRALGAVMRHARKLRWCEPTDEFRSGTKVRSHRRPERVWSSKLYREGGGA